MSVSYLKMPEAVVLDETSYTNTFGKFFFSLWKEDMELH